MHKAVLDGRQLALKISANSVYGFTGAKVSRFIFRFAQFAGCCLYTTARTADATPRNGFRDSTRSTATDDPWVLALSHITSISHRMRRNSAIEWQHAHEWTKTLQSGPRRFCLLRTHSVSACIRLGISTRFPPGFFDSSDAWDMYSSARARHLIALLQKFSRRTSDALTGDAEAEPDIASPMYFLGD